MKKIPLILYKEPPGKGKTHRIKVRFENNPGDEHVVFAETHRELDEYNNISNVCHWKGFSHHCIAPDLKRLHKNFGIGSEILCVICQQQKRSEYKKCQRHQQFETKEPNIVAPIQYSPTHYFDKRKTKSFIVEERIDKGIPLKTPSPTCFGAHRGILENEITNLPRNIRDLYLNHAEELNEMITNHIRFKVNKDLEKHGRLTEDTKYYINGPLTEMSPIDIKNWFLLSLSYPSIETHGHTTIPYLTYIAKLAYEKNGTIEINDATGHDSIIKALCDRVEVDLYTLFNIQAKMELTIDEKPTTVEKEGFNSLIINVNPKAWYPKDSLHSLKTLDNVCSSIEEVCRLLRIKQPGIVTYKGSIKENIRIKLNNFNPEFLTFGDLRSQNTFKDHWNGFVVGTFNTPKLEHITQAKLLFPDIDLGRFTDLDTKYKHITDPNKRTESENVELNEIMKRESGDSGQYRFKDYHKDCPDIKLLESIRQMHEDDEMYQAIHRFRGLRKNTIILVFGKVPEQIRKEFPVLELNLGETIQYIKNLTKKIGKQNNISIESLIKSIINEKEQEGYDKIAKTHLREILKEKTNIGQNKIDRYIDKFVEDNGYSILGLRKGNNKEGPKTKYLILNPSEKHK